MKLYSYLLIVFLVVSGIGHVSTLHAEMPEAGDDRVDTATQRAVAFLLTQQKSDGAIFDAGNQTAMTALSIMAMCSVGHVPTDQTREGEALRKALEFVLRNDRQDNQGYFGNSDGSRMYGHGIITLMLAEVLGMGVDRDQDRRIRQKLDKAIKLIIRAQDRKQNPNDHQYGGWRYAPDAGDSDLSVSIWQTVSLRAAKNAGMEVPKSAIDKAVKYIKRCYRSDRDKDGNLRNMRSAFAYQPGGAPTYTSASYGLLALQICGEYEAPEVKASADWLFTRRLKYNERYFFYGTYYYAQGMYQRGGKYAEHAKKSVETALLKKQKDNGSWRADGLEHGVGTVYATSMAVLSLSVEHHYLPIYQR